MNENKINRKKIKLIKRNNYNNIITKKDYKGNIVLVNKLSNYQISNLYFEIDNDSSLKRFIKNVEKLVRTSSEYKKYLSILMQDMKITNDALMSNINTDMATLEFHHYPFTLYEIVDIVITKHIMEDEQFTSIDIAEKVLKLHFENKVGLVLLSKTNHQLAHAGKVIVPMASVFGRVNQFVLQYKDYIMDHKIEEYNNLVDKADI